MTQKSINDLSYKIIGCAIEVHKELGPGLLETVYETCLIDELITTGLSVKSQMLVPIKYKKKILNSNLILDILVEDTIIVELKTVEAILPVHKAQLHTYLKLTNKPKGLLINFYSEVIKDQIVSYVTPAFSDLPKQ
ncbi:MAG TPA: GxxExxY protein [Ignavibacteria bacterium]|nr:GxxExxY protein [Ignavibacteria bacterium]HMQ97881.1 GxxExxY protein [Ignavibacteria bacterium]